MKRIETLSKILPIGGVFILLCSSIKLVIYYKTFNISITDFLSIGEYATLFIDDILQYLAIFGLGIFLIMLSPNQQRKADFETDNNSYPIYKKQKRWIITLSLIVLIPIISVFFYIDSIESKLDTTKFGIYILLTFFYCYALFTKIKFSYFSYIISVLLIYTVMDGFIDAQKIIENNNKLNYNITFENKVIETNNDLHYLGKSEKYLFLYSLKNKKSTIIPIEKLTKITIEEK
jgi:hypothetical protein|tara:strand:- start:82 stop:780 length:699 start_codon:yes stop_codon:yes gene_type:complete